MGVPVYRTASTVPQYTDISVYRYTPRSQFQISYKFLMKFLLANRIATYGTPHSEIHGYTVCLCPMKGTPGLNELNGTGLFF